MGRLEKAFDTLDRGKNSVAIWDLRAALPDVPRPAFDAALRELRVRDTFSMDTSEGYRERPTPEQAAAGIRERSTSKPLVYVSRRRD